MTHAAARHLIRRRGSRLSSPHSRVAVTATVLALAISGCATGGDDGSGGGGSAGSGTIVGTLKAGSVNPAYVPWVNKAGAICNDISAPLLAAQLDTESGWNPNAVSPVGADGIAQFMPGTWKTYSNDANNNGTSSPFDPPDAIMAQGHLMCDLDAQVTKDLSSGLIHGQLIQLVLAGYNAGIGAVEKAGGIPGNAQTQGYVQKIPALAISKYGGSWSNPAGTVAGDGTLASAIAIEKSKVGTPYVWGGGTVTGPSGIDGTSGQGPGWDCSSFQQYGIYQATHGKATLPRTAAAQQAGLAKYAQPFTSVSALKPGDLLYYGSPAHHVAMYIGNNQIIAEPKPFDHAKIEPIYGPIDTVVRLPLTQMTKGGN